MNTKLWPLLTLGLLVAAGAHAADASTQTVGDAERGGQLYASRCGGCHSIDANRIGPSHAGVFGRAAGKWPGYDFSPALKASRLKWDEKNLDRWLADPQKLVPGQKMGYSVPDAKDRADLIAHLKSVPATAP